MEESTQSNSTTVDDYHRFRKNYLKQFSNSTLSYLSELEKKETWSISVEMQKVVDTFNKLPSVCRNPLAESDIALVVKLIRLIAYLPFKESMTALAWLGFENEDYGFAIYRVAYEFYDDHSSEYANAHTIVERSKVMVRIAMLQQTLGRKA